jgi:hypothetical protein
MIILYPTGLYADAGQIPETPSTAGNITYTISNEIPTRPTSLTLQLPLAEELMPLPSPAYSVQTRRAQYGQLIYTYVTTNQTETGSNTKLFGVGEYLDFNSQEITLPEQPSIPNVVDIQHNTNVLDLSGAGLDESQIASLVDQSTTMMATLESQVSTIQSQITNQQIAISENQKQINEIIKIIDAVRVVVGIPEGSMQTNPMLSQLLAQQATYEATQTSLIANLNNLNIQATTVLDALLSVSELVK